MDWQYGIVLYGKLLLSLNLCLLGVTGDKPKILKGSMGSKSFCKSSKTRWLSEQTSALITGKSDDDLPKECMVVFGAAVDPSKSVRLRVHFDFIYFDSCGVKLQINQSTNMFGDSKNNKEMFMSGCNRKNPGPLYTQPQHYLLISLTKTDRKLEGYNFRLNVSVAEHLPVTGAPLRTVIIVSFVCFVVVAGAVFVLFKYVNHLSMEWGEDRREQGMDRAIQLYNTASSREASGEDELTMALVEPGAGVRLRQPRPEIAFVHGDGRVLRFQPLLEEDGGDSDDTGSGGDGAGTHPRHRHRQKQHHHHHAQSNHKPLSSASAASPTKQPTGASPRVVFGRGGSPGEEPTHFFLSFSSNPDRQHHQQQQQLPLAPSVARVIPSSSDVASPPPLSGSRVDDNIDDDDDDERTDNADATSVGGLDLPPSYEEALAMPLPVSEDDDGSGGGACGGGSSGVNGSSFNPDSTGTENNNRQGDIIHTGGEDSQPDATGSGRDYMNFLAINQSDSGGGVAVDDNHDNETTNIPTTTTTTTILEQGDHSSSPLS